MILPATAPADAIATAIEENLCGYAAAFGRTPHAEIGDQAGSLWASTHIPTQYALVEAQQHGYTIGTLLSSAMAEELYRQLGFQEYCRLHIYN